METLSEEEIKNFLREIPAWTLQEDGRLYRKYLFKDFTAAFSFISYIAIHAEKMNHHPEWSNTFNKVELRLTTHEARGLTKLDTEFARLMEAHFRLRVGP